jgi:hypothetical protein
MSSSFRKSVRPVAGAVAFACAASAAHAQAWIFDPRVEVAAVYDDNYRLTDQRGQEIEVKGGALDAALNMHRDTQTTTFGLTPRIHSTFFDVSSEEATEYYLDGIAEKKTQRLDSKFEAHFADESVVSSELPAADFPGLELGQPTSGDNGRVTFRNRRRLIVAEPSLVWDWTERRHLTGDLQYVDAKYDRNDFFEQTSYRTGVGSVGILFNTTQRSTLWFRVAQQVYDPDNSTPNTDTTSATVEYRTSTTQITSFYVRGGAAHSTRDANATAPGVSETSFDGGVGVAWSLQTTQIVLDFLRSSSPSSVGAVVNRDEARFRLTHQFDPRFSGDLAVRGIRTTGLTNDVSAVRDRKYAAGTISFEWRASRQFSIHGAYDYTWQKFQFQPNDAVSNGVTLSVVYEPRRLEK